MQFLIISFHDNHSVFSYRIDVLFVNPKYEEMSPCYLCMLLKPAITSANKETMPKEYAYPLEATRSVLESLKIGMTKVYFALVMC